MKAVMHSAAPMDSNITANSGVTPGECSTLSLKCWPLSWSATDLLRTGGRIQESRPVWDRAGLAANAVNSEPLTAAGAPPLHSALHGAHVHTKGKIHRVGANFGPISGPYERFSVKLLGQLKNSGP